MGRLWLTYKPVAAMLGALTLTLTLAVTSVTSLMEEEEPITCLEGEMRCRGDEHCRSLLDNIPDVCDRAADTCRSPRYELCVNVLSTLQRSSHFRGCLCDVFHHGNTECNRLKKIIYHHACLYKVLAHNSSYSLPSQATSLVRTHGDQAVTEIDNDVIHRPRVGRFESCIAIRKRCLLDYDCERKLEEFREYCRESKKQNQCVTNKREECFRAITYLEHSGLFGCRCDHIAKDEPKEKCDRIQYRVANNTCLVDVPYFIYSTGLHDNSHAGSGALVDPALGDEIQDAQEIASTCNEAFADCHLDPGCRLRTANFQNSCLWDSHTSTCDKTGCLQALQDFFMFVRPQLAQAQLFCRCRPGDKSCEKAKKKLYPVCSVVDHPAPTCLDIMGSCLRDEDCSVRLKAYEKYCGYHKREGLCPSGAARCRNAMLGIMGTVLTTNCTCIMKDFGDLQDCEDARNRIQHQNDCKRTSIEDFHKLRRIEQREREQTIAENSIKISVEVAANSNNDRHDCQRQLGRYFPSFMRAPTVIRRYQNDSDCSDVCQCQLNGTLKCRDLSCKPDLVCRADGRVYRHGVTFARDSSEGGGQCRCIKGEVVCAKPARLSLNQAGLFLHVGYSLSDMYLVEDHSTVVFDPENVAEKLGAILNEDSAEQFCSLSLHTQVNGNLLFLIGLSEHSPKMINKMNCHYGAKLLMDKINFRNPIIVADAELSVLKVAEVENITIHKPPRGREDLNHIGTGSRTGRGGSSGRSRDHYNSAFVLIMAFLVLAWTR